jgi:hypothetical protein
MHLETNFKIDDKASPMRAGREGLLSVPAIVTAHAHGLMATPDTTISRFLDFRWSLRIALLGVVGNAKRLLHLFGDERAANMSVRVVEDRMPGP